MADSAVRVQRVDNQIERRVLTAMIVSTPFLKEVRPICDPDRMEIPYSRVISKWCLEYFGRYEEAPRAHIQELFLSWRKAEEDDVLVQNVSDFLGQLSEDYEDLASAINVRYLADEAERLFNSRALLRTAESVKAHLALGDIQAADADLAQHIRIQRSASQGANPFRDADLIYRALGEEAREPIISFPGALGAFLDPMMIEEGFIGIMGPFKRGKSFWLQEFGIAAVKCLRNVAYFSAGDMNQEELTARHLSRISGRPYQWEDCKRPLHVPVLDCLHNQRGTCPKGKETGPAFPDLSEWDGDPATLMRICPRDHKPCTRCLREDPPVFRGAFWYEIRSFDEPLSWTDGLKIGDIFFSRMGSRDYKLISYPNLSLKVSDIESQLSIWEHYDGFVPHVIIVDYADILAPEDPRKETRHQHNETWMALRRMSQRRRCLVITATQTDAEAMDLTSLRNQSFSEDVRKYAHVTGMLTLNQTEKEKRMGMMRLGWLMRRSGMFDRLRHVRVLESRSTGRPCIASFF